MKEVGDHKKFILSINARYVSCDIRESFKISNEDIDNCKTKQELEKLIHKVAYELLFENIDFSYWEDVGEENENE